MVISTLNAVRGGKAAMEHYPGQYGVEILLNAVHITPQEFENATFFLRLGIPSTKVCHENGAFRKCFSNRRNLKTPAVRFHVDRKHFENETFRKRRGSEDCCVFKFFRWTENMWCVFRVKPPFSNSSGLVWTGPWVLILHFGISSSSIRDTCSNEYINILIFNN